MYICIALAISLFRRAGERQRAVAPLSVGALSRYHRPADVCKRSRTKTFTGCFTTGLKKGEICLEVWSERATSYKKQRAAHYLISQHIHFFRAGRVGLFFSPKTERAQ